MMTITAAPHVLSDENLGLITAANVEEPGYNRQKLKIGVLHFGPGHCFRANFASFLDTLAKTNPEVGSEWGVAAVSLFSGKTIRQLREQDNLYTLRAAQNENRRTRIVGIVKEGILGLENRERVFELMDMVPVVSITVKRDGYHFDRTGKLDFAQAAIIDDVMTPSAPVSVVGFIVEGLRRRKAAGKQPFVVLSLDNLEDVHAVRRAVIDLAAKQKDPQLAKWITTHGEFTVASVDRISPDLDENMRRELADAGIIDQCPVAAESQKRLVIGGSNYVQTLFAPLREVGVIVCDEETCLRHRAHKAQCVNGTHMTLGMVGSLLNVTFVHEAMAIPALAKLAERRMFETEVALLPIEGTQYSEYVQTTLERCRNWAIADTSVRVARDTTSKLFRFVLTALQTAIEYGTERRALTFLLACWPYHLLGTAPDRLELDDPLRHDFTQMAEAMMEVVSRREPSVDYLKLIMTSTPELRQLSQDPAFVQEFLDALVQIRRLGLRGALEALEY